MELEPTTLRLQHLDFTYYCIMTPTVGQLHGKCMCMRCMNEHVIMKPSFIYSLNENRLSSSSSGINFHIFNFFTRARQIIRYRATATLWRLQIKQYTASNEGGYKTYGNILKL